MPEAPIPFTSVQHLQAVLIRTAVCLPRNQNAERRII